MCREAQYKRREDNTELNFSRNQNKTEESKATFLLSWLEDKDKQDLKWYTWDEDRGKDTKVIHKRLNKRSNQTDWKEYNIEKSILHS